MATTRFIGARLDHDIVFLDRSTGRLIHLEPGAVRVWERCLESADGAVGPPVMAETAAILAELEHAGVVMRLDGRHVPASVEWT